MTPVWLTRTCIVKGDRCTVWVGLNSQLEPSALVSALNRMNTTPMVNETCNARKPHRHVYALALKGEKVNLS